MQRLALCFLVVISGLLVFAVLCWSIFLISGLVALVIDSRGLLPVKKTTGSPAHDVTLAALISIGPHRWEAPLRWPWLDWPALGEGSGRCTRLWSVIGPVSLIKAKC